MDFYIKNRLSYIKKYKINRKRRYTLSQDCSVQPVPPGMMIKKCLNVDIACCMDFLSHLKQYDSIGKQHVAAIVYYNKDAYTSI